SCQGATIQREEAGKLCAVPPDETDRIAIAYPTTNGGSSTPADCRRSRAGLSRLAASLSLPAVRAPRYPSRIRQKVNCPPILKSLAWSTSTGRSHWLVAA